MVCNRCIKVVKDELSAKNIDFLDVELGNIYFENQISDATKNKISILLEKEGFELLEDREAKIISEIKSLVIEHNHSKKGNKQKLSTFLATSIGVDYTLLSKMFSNIEGRSIENYVIAQKIEKAKELLIYNELTLSQISYELDYSSPQHLSRQFRQVIGLTPSEFKKIGNRKNLDTI